VKKEKTPEQTNTETNADSMSVANKGTAQITKVGTMLKSLRQQKGLKIVDISKKLCIRKCYLEAIENSNYKELPAVPYGIGFIRSYANYLGLNGENIVELYKEETNTPKNDDMRILEAQPEATVPGLQYLLISLLAVAAIYAAWVFFNKNDVSVSENLPEETITNEEENAEVVVIEDFNPVSDESAKTESEKTVVDNDVVVMSDEKYVDDKQSVTENDETVNNIDSVKAGNTSKAEEIVEEKTEKNSTQGVVVEVLKETWIEVKDKNKLYISKVLNAGDSYRVPEGSGMILSVGKHDGVNVYINGVLTKVAKATKKTNIELDPFLAPKH